MVGSDCCTMFRLEQDFRTPNNARCGKELESTVSRFPDPNFAGLIILG